MNNEKILEKEIDLIQKIALREWDRILLVLKVG